MNYATIKATAAARGCRVTDLIVLSPQNDPYYVGTPSSLRDGEWFAELWARFGYGTGVHLRRVHYQIISQREPVYLANGTPYENTERCWQALDVASKAARYLGLVDPAAFVDQRNPDPLVAEPPADEEPEVYVSGDLDAEAPSLPALPAWPSCAISGFEGRQPFALEVWCEKSTMNDVLEPLCERYGATLQVGVGELSITAALGLVRRVDDRPVRVFYVSDFDPAGQSMPVAVARKVEFFLRERPEVDLRIYPIVLTRDQVEAYRLPRVPIKDTERRRAAFEARHGDGAVELDALEALHPGVLGELVTEAITSYFDPTLHRRVMRAQWALEAELAELEARARQAFEGELEAIGREYEALQADYVARLGDVWTRAADLRARMAEWLEDGTPEPVVPEARPATEIEDPLFDSRRSYDLQLMFYKSFQGKLR